MDSSKTPLFILKLATVYWTLEYRSISRTAGPGYGTFESKQEDEHKFQRNKAFVTTEQIRYYCE